MRHFKIDFDALKHFPIFILYIFCKHELVDTILSLKAIQGYTEKI